MSRRSGDMYNRMLRIMTLAVLVGQLSLQIRIASVMGA